MEKETNTLLWAIFGISVLTVAIIPSAWGMLGRTTATGVVKNADMAKALWGQSTGVSQVVSQMANDQNVAIIPGAITPHIEEVSWGTSKWGPTLTLKGYGFGNPPSGDKATLVIVDQSRGWATGNASSYGVKPQISTWTNEKIVVSGFTGYGQTDMSDWSDGLGAWVFAPGDNVLLQLTNPQTGNTNTDHVTYPADAPMPTVTVSPIPALVSGAPTVFTGVVTYMGQPLADQSVNVSVTTGMLGGTAYTNHQSQHVVYTDFSGHFSIPYTASTSGTITVTFMADGVTVTKTITVLSPNLVLQVDVPTPNLSLPIGAVNTWNGNVNDFPFYAFSQLPINMSFSEPAKTVSGRVNTLWNPDSAMNFWIGQNLNFPNGVQFDRALVTVPSSETAYISLPDALTNGWVDDFEVIYIDGKPVAMSNGSYGANALEFEGIPMFASNTERLPVQLHAGENDIVIEGLNTDGFNGAGMQPAFMDLKITDTNGNTLLSTAQAFKWQSTGYIQSTPSSWKVAATEYVLQEAYGQPVYQQQTSAALVGQRYPVSGRLTSNGKPVANQTLTLSATGGDVSPNAVTTDAQGYFSATFQAPRTPGTYRITATGAGTTGSTKVTVVQNQLVSGPIMDGMPSQWSGNWASHMYLTNLPKGAQILATNGSQPTAAYFRDGNGQVLVDTQTVEFYYQNANWATTEWNNIIHDFIGPSKKPVLLLYDGAYWGNNAGAVNAIRQAVPDASENALNTPSIPDISQYGTIVVDAVQSWWFKQNLEQVMPQLNAWVRNGGTLIFDSTDQENMQWSIGPDGISSVWHLAPWNYLAGNLK